MRNSPLVSVLVPVYNGAKYLRDCLESIIQQTYRNIEIIIVNDGSTDSTLSICKEYELNDQRIKVINTDNNGVASARNKLIELAKGDYIQFIDADDWIELNMIQDMVSLISIESSDIAICQYIRENYNTINTKTTTNIDATTYDRTISSIDQYESIIRFLIHREITGSLWNKLIKRSCIKDIHFDKEISYGEDALFIWQILQNIKKVTITDTIYYHYRLNNSSISSSGLSQSKLSSIRAWKHICNSISDNDTKQKKYANSRFGIEMALLLYEAAKNKAPINDNIRLLRKILRKQLPYVIKTRHNSIKLKIFSIISSYCWFLTRFV